MFVSNSDVISFVQENDVKFIRMSFSDLKGNLKNLAVMSNELPSVLENGVTFDASCLEKDNHEKFILMPETGTMSVLPWRPKSGSVIRFFCNILKYDGTPYECDVRRLLASCVDDMKNTGLECKAGTKSEFYLFKNDENGYPTDEPADNGGYLDVTPLDKGENIRREICLSLEEMGIAPYKSCHKRGPGQNEIDFSRSNPLTAADDVLQYKNTVKSIAAQSGLYASFMPMPLADHDGSSLNIYFHVNRDGKTIFSKDNLEGKAFTAGILNRLAEITAFINPVTNSYRRLGSFYAPKYIAWSHSDPYSSVQVSNKENYSYLVCRQSDNACNPYLAILLLLRAGMEGIENNLDLDDFKPTELPHSLEESVDLMKNSEFVNKNLPESFLNHAYEHYDEILSEYKNADSVYEFEKSKFFYTI